jgi:hypothetical protein
MNFGAGLPRPVGLLWVCQVSNDPNKKAGAVRRLFRQILWSLD